MRHTLKSFFAFAVVTTACSGGLLQVLINLMLVQRVTMTGRNLNCESQSEKAEIANLSRQVHALQLQLQAANEFQKDQQDNKDLNKTANNVLHRGDGVLFPFTIRDSRRLVPTQIPFGFHVFDYVDVHSRDQLQTDASKLFLDGKLIPDEPAPCQKYQLACYKEKVLQVFDIVLNTSESKFFFYMEADNDLCVSLEYIQNLAVRHNRYFITAGVGFSGWIMSRQFMLDFLNEYNKVQGSFNLFQLQPDSVASSMMIEKGNWAVTRQYLVSHTTLPALGAKGLTLKNTGKLDKHLPRCFEPHRGVWIKPGSKVEKDMYGWDYFDYKECGDAEIYPCES